MIAGPIADRIEPVVRQMVDVEIERRMAPIVAKRIAADKADADIMEAARRVGLLTDKVQQAQFAGQGEIAARKKLFFANLKLATVMRLHGRMP